MFDAFDFVEEIQRELGAERTYRFAQKFMLSYLMSMRELLPVVAGASLHVADRFLAGDASRHELDRARVACWQFLDERNASAEFTQPENCAVRATICLLRAEASDSDVPGLVEWFLELTNRVRDQADTPETMMRTIFEAQSS